MLPILKSIYSLPEPPQKRSRPLKVICLGLPRSGTESLHNALQILGYEGVSHGFDWWLNDPNCSMLYFELLLLKLEDRMPDSETLREKYFDRLLEDKEASTDVPSVWFASELLQAYPDAMVILNQRRDVNAWKTSFRASVLPMMQSWKYWLASWFDAELFWGVWLTHLGHQKLLFKDNFEGNAEKAYLEHYKNLEQILSARGREYLDWSVDDGWEPLCRFLNLPKPTAQFPRGNMAAEFGPKLMTVDEERFRRARKNLLVVSSSLVAIGTGLWLQRWKI